MNTDIKGKWALVTGASSGIGKELARELALRGANLVLVARRKEALEGLAAELGSAFRVKTRVEVSDLARKGEPERLFGALSAAGIQVAILANNAGFGAHGPFDGIDPKSEEGMIDLNIGALVRLTRLFSGPMRAAGFGRILFTSSIGAFMPSPTYATYCATKAFVLSYGLAVRAELAGTGVTATVLYPGVTDTAFHSVAAHEISTNAFKRATSMGAEPVAKAAVRGLLRGKAEVIPGFVNRISIFSSRLVPRPALAAISGKSMA